MGGEGAGEWRLVVAAGFGVLTLPAGRRSPTYLKNRIYCTERVVVAVAKTLDCLCGERRGRVGG